MVAAAVRYANGALGVIDAPPPRIRDRPSASTSWARRAGQSLAGTSLIVQWQDGRGEELVPDGSAGGTGANTMAFPHDYHRSVLA